jgi:hypothetical protein
MKGQNTMMLSNSDKTVKDMYAKLELAQRQLLSERTVNGQLTEKI